MTNHIVFAFTFAGIFVIAGCGLFVLTGMSRQVSIAQGAYMALGAGVTCALSRSPHPSGHAIGGMGYSYFLSLLLSGVIVGGAAAILGAVFFRFRGTTAIIGSYLISFFILFFIYQSSVLNTKILSGSSTKVQIGAVDFTHLVMMGHHFTQQSGLLMFIALFVLAAVGYTYNVSRSPLSRSMKAVAENESASKTYAISPLRVIPASHFICGVFAGVSGGLFVISLREYHMFTGRGEIIAWTFSLSIVLAVIIAIGRMKKILPTILLFAIVAGTYFYFVATATVRDVALTIVGEKFTPLYIVYIVVAILGIVTILAMSRSAKNKL